MTTKSSKNMGLTLDESHRKALRQALLDYEYREHLRVLKIGANLVPNVSRLGSVLKEATAIINSLPKIWSYLAILGHRRRIGDYNEEVARLERLTKVVRRAKTNRRVGRRRDVNLNRSSDRSRKCSKTLEDSQRALHARGNKKTEPSRTFCKKPVKACSFDWRKNRSSSISCTPPCSIFHKSRSLRTRSELVGKELSPNEKRDGKSFLGWVNHIQPRRDAPRNRATVN